MAHDVPDETPESVSTETEPLEDEGECFEATEYVNQLIARMNGSAAPSKAASAGQAEASLSSAATAPTRDAPVPRTIATSAAKQQPKAAPTRRPQRPSEMPTDLTRLREAANLTATSDLKAHEFRRSVVKAYSDLVMVVASMATSLVLVSLSDRLFSVAYVCAVVTLVQAATATQRFFQTTEVLARNAPNGPAISEQTN